MKHFKKTKEIKKIGFILIAVNIFSAVFSMAFAADETTVGRYLTVVNKPSAAQMDLLSQTIQIRFPQDVQSIADAMHYLLRYSGYSLVDEAHQSTALKTTLKKPLPLVDRTLQPMSLKDALIILAGPAFTLLEDPLNRAINFHVKAEFEKKSFF